MTFPLFPPPMMGRGSALAAAVLVGASSGTTTATAITIPWPGGLLVGDFAFVGFTKSPSGNTPPSGWGSYSEPLGAQNLTAFWKLLTSTDLASNPSFSGPGNSGTYHMAVFRGGVTSIVLRNSIGVAGTTLTLTGYAPAANTRGPLAFVGDAEATIPTSPADWLHATTPQGTSLSVGVLDYKPDYTGGNPTWTAFGSSSDQRGFLFELLH
jgi:hypothetical protein